MGWAVARRKPFFVGKRSLQIHDKGPLQRVLAGFSIDDPGQAVPREGHLVLDGRRLSGRVTSCAVSPSLKKVIGLAFVPPANAGLGDRITIRCDGGQLVEARVVEVPFYDRENARQEL